ncbi:MAG: hypothetical protein QXV17_04875 [Candidatus Micrarchaeaceae archaeon]
MSKQVGYKITNNFWVLISAVTMTEVGLGAYLRGIIEFNVSTLYKNTFIYSFGT